MPPPPDTGKRSYRLPNAFWIWVRCVTGWMNEAVDAFWFYFGYAGLFACHDENGWSLRAR